MGTIEVKLQCSVNLNPICHQSVMDDGGRRVKAWGAGGVGSGERGHNNAPDGGRGGHPTLPTQAAFTFLGGRRRLVTGGILLVMGVAHCSTAMSTRPVRYSGCFA